jgi:acetoin utilization protein AcuC
VMVLDTDAHAGNGTSEYLRGNNKVLYVDVHQDPRTIYPGTGFTSDIGADNAKGLTINIPMPVHAGNASYLMAFDRVILPVAREFKPQIIIRNGGSDPHFNDGLTNLGMTVSGFRVMGDRVRELAEVSQGKLIDLIASGYNEHVLPYAWLSLESGVANFPITVEEPEQVPPQYEQDMMLSETEKVLEEVRRFHHTFWQCFR